MSFYLICIPYFKYKSKVYKDGDLANVLTKLVVETKMVFRLLAWYCFITSISNLALSQDSTIHYILLSSEIMNHLYSIPFRSILDSNCCLEKNTYRITYIKERVFYK